jgi:hypothetical protein
MASLNKFSKKQSDRNKILSKRECLVDKPRRHVEGSRGICIYILSFLNLLVGIAWSASGPDRLIHWDKGARWRACGAVLLLPLYAFMICRGCPLPYLAPVQQLPSQNVTVHSRSVPIALWAVRCSQSTDSLSRHPPYLYSIYIITAVNICSAPCAKDDGCRQLVGFMAVRTAG